MNSLNAGRIARKIAQFGRNSWILSLALLVLAAPGAFGQLTGTYTIGGASPNYATIDAAIAALNAAGVSGPVTFLIRSGTYAPPAGGYTLRANAGMSATNTVTFKPDAGASVTISGTTDTLTGVFTIDGGKHYILDGSNTVGGTTRDMLIRQTRTTTNPAVWMIGDADHNTVKNCVLVGAGEKQTWSDPAAGQGVVGVGPGTATQGNDSNLIQNNRVGDSTGALRSNIGIAVEAPWNTGLNRGNRVLGNEVLNFGRSNGPYSIGILIGGGLDNTLAEGNEVHMTVRAPAPYLMGIAVASSSGVIAPSGTVVNANRIHHLTSTWDGYSAYAILEDHSNVAGDVTITNNMISLVDDGDIYLSGVLSQGFASTVNVYHNSIYIGGTAPSRGTRHARGIVNIYSNFLTLKNNIINSVRTGGNALNSALYINDTTNYVSDYNIISYNTGARYYTAYLGDNTGFGGVTRLTFRDFQSNTAYDQHSFSATPPFTDAANGDLHLALGLADTNGDKGTPIADVATDYDKQDRDATTPDIGADEAGAGGIRIAYPNGGQTLAAEDTVNVAFTVNRAMNVRVDFSTDGGLNWIRGVSRDAVAGANVMTVTLPNVATNRARIRVANTADGNEADLSDRDFTVAAAVITLVRPNGGDTLVPTDQTRIEFTARYLAAAIRLRAEFSTDDGITWNLIDTNIRAAAYPAVTALNWNVPDRPTTKGRVRIVRAGTTLGDTSNAAFIITPAPSLAFAAPLAGSVLYAGERATIMWTSTTTNRVHLAYSLDDGATWRDLGPGFHPADPGAFSWIIPNTPSERVQLRIVNAERPRYSDTITSLAIRKASVRVQTPNGGEEYEPGAPVTVTWEAATPGPLRLEYTGDNGRTWRVVDGNVAAAAGSHTFTPAATPTRFARVRITDPARLNVVDVSDSSFAILPERGITILAPTDVDVLSRGQQTQIVWNWSRVAAVDIAYSPDGGATWSTVAGNVPASLGAYAWNVPDAVTREGRIRISETGGNIVAESGPFAIVEQPTVGIRVLAPNGGERYRAGETVAVRWNASGIESSVEVAFSSDQGATWTTIGKRHASAGAIDWQIASAPGDGYRIRVATGNIGDVSDSTFTVVPRDVPGLELIAPNGGERLVMGATTPIRWSARSIGDDVVIEFSSDAGATWSGVGTASAAAGSLAWTVPAVETERGMIRISAKTGGASDASAAPFAIVRPGTVTLLTPNGGERWLQNTYQTVRWSAPSAVNLEYSIDAGATWTTLATDLESVEGTNEYRWLTPGLSADAINTVLVRVSDAADASVVDVSDAPFSLLRVAGVTGDRNSSGQYMLGVYPNPVNERAEIRWRQAVAGDVEIRLYNAAGEVVSYAGHREPGEHRFELRADALPAGMYLCALRIAGTVLHSAVMVVR